MAGRSHARRQALDILYQADVTGADASTVLLEWEASGRDIPRFTRELIEGAAGRVGELDRLIGDHAEGWTVPRMATVDRNILRLACFELLHRSDVPVSVAINEAVEAAKELSTEESSAFVNGILAAIAREVVGVDRS